MLIVNNISYRHLLHHTQLAFEPGKLHGLLGPNGAGKTTFFKLLTGIWKPSSGEVLWNGKPLHTLDRRKLSQTISFVSQTPITFPYHARQIVEMGRYPHGNTPCDNLIDWAIDAVNAAHFQDRLMTELSQGEQQRILIARALVTDTPILLLDEPTSHLDITHQIQVWELLQSLAESGKLIFTSSHNLTQAERYCHEITLIKKGEILGQGKYHDLLYNGAFDKTFDMNVSKVQLMNSDVG
ncbi:MAG: ABC transporter ATP-binding protein [Waddliaceae bacterium]